MVRAETQTTPTQSKQYLFKRLGVLPNRRLPIGQKFLPLRTLRLCGEVLVAAQLRYVVTGVTAAGDFGAPG